MCIHVKSNAVTSMTIKKMNKYDENEVKKSQKNTGWFRNNILEVVFKQVSRCDIRQSELCIRTRSAITEDLQGDGLFWCVKLRHLTSKQHWSWAPLRLRNPLVSQRHCVWEQSAMIQSKQFV